MGVIGLTPWNPSPRGGGTAMITAIIRWSIHNRLLVAPDGSTVGRLGCLVGPPYPLDALPDLSDVQVIVKTNYPGQGAPGSGKPGFIHWRRRCWRCRAR